MRRCACAKNSQDATLRITRGGDLILRRNTHNGADGVLDILAEIGTKVLCIDEVHHLPCALNRANRLQSVANELKTTVKSIPEALFLATFLAYSQPESYSE
jgi:hypothetical protein